MQIARDGAWWAAARVTGPSHNVLRLKFAAEDGDVPVLEDLASRPRPGGVLAGQVAAEVAAAVADWNLAQSDRVAVAGIGFMSTDSPLAGVYRLLATALIENERRGRGPS